MIQMMICLFNVFFLSFFLSLSCHHLSLSASIHLHVQSTCFSMTKCVRVPNEHFGAAEENTSFLYTNILVKYKIEI